MSMLDAFFYKGFKGSKCNTLLKLSMPRIKLLRNRREIQIRQMRKDIAKLLEAGQEATARIRVEHIIREENMMAAQEILELFCELIAVRVPIIETQRECPLDLKEAISSLCFAAPRCADLPELQQVQLMFASKYGKEFVSAATGLMPDCGVNRQLIELLSVRAPAPEKKLELLKEIAEEHNLDWNPEATETAFFKQPEDLLNGPSQFVSGSKLPLPKEKHDEVVYSTTTTSQGPKEQSDDEDFEVLNFPEVPKVSVRPNADTPSAPETVTPFAANLDLERMEKLSTHLGAKDNPLLMEQLESDNEELEQERPVPSKYEPNKQFLPFISPPSPSSPQTYAMKNNSPPCLSTTKNEVTVDLQDVLAAAHAAADSAERAAAAARSAASLAQRRITELIKQKNDADIEAAFENPFPSENLNDSAVKEKQHLDHVDSTDSSGAIQCSPDMPSFKEKQHLDSVDSAGSSDAFLYSPDMPTFDTPKGDDDDSAFSNDHTLQHGFDNHQPQRLPSMDDDSYFSYPNLFSSQGSHHGPGGQSLTNSRSTDKL